jgi:serine/threonine-protein phosphatase 2A regulatory subunit A
MVRRESCNQLKNLAQHADIDSLKRLIIPKFVELSKDEQDSVRLLAVDNAVSIAKRLSPEENIVLVLGTVLECANDKSWRVRYMVADLFCKV